MGVLLLQLVNTLLLFLVLLQLLELLLLELLLELLLLQLLQLLLAKLLFLFFLTLRCSCSLAFLLLLTLLLLLALLGLLTFLLLLLLQLLLQFALLLAQIRRRRRRGTNVHRRRATLTSQTGLYLLLLLQGLHEGRFQTVRMLGLECLLNIASNTLLADDLRVFSSLFFPLPNRGEVDFALGAAVRLLREIWFLVLGEIVDDVLQAQQVDELRIAGIGDEVHLRRRRLGRWDL